MSTFGTMVTRIINETHRTTSDNASIKDAIVSAIEHYKYTRFWFNEDWAEVTTTDGTNRYVDGDFTEDDGATNLAWADILEIYNVYYNVGTSYRYEMDRITQRDIDAINVVASFETYPWSYAVLREGLQLYPTPSTTGHKIEMLILRDFNTITNASADAVTNAWMVEAEELIRNRAKRDFYSNFLHNAPGANEAMRYEMEAYNKLITSTERRLDSNIVVTPYS